MLARWPRFPGQTCDDEPESGPFEGREFMPSPFPGMNPFLEQEEVWQDFHQRFITYSAGALAAQVEPDYIVKIEEHLYIHELSAERRLLGRGDVTISASPAPLFQSEHVAVLPAPVTVQLPAVDIERAAFL